ncbi:ABC transporter permease [Nodosilinea sp. LEGE 07088]|uniref:ABC transporter permease n=1 Tax=Nodosilinea sp. LEGE 07088 TaxID=2777968 RepID=UPI00187EE020|nr:ABC transporter permease [Nodosilinea sp. LEGE 07088]MBE9141004.1 ABC transporter permease [Nodosilinea sp. LEGE 07088]
MRRQRSLERQSQIIRTYQAGEKSLWPVGSVKLAFRELYFSRHAIWHLFVRDFVAGFRQKIFGYFWILASPLLGILSFVFMNSTGILNPGELEIPYPIFVFVGTSLWSLLTITTTTVANGLIGNSDLIMRTNIPKIGLAVTGMASVLYNFLVSIAVLFIILLAFQLWPALSGLMYPLAVVPLVMMGIGFGLMLAVVGSVARDITSIFINLLGLAMYITPVVYSAEFANPQLQQIVRLNPLTYLVDTPRSLLILGRVSSPLGFMLASLVAVLVLVAGIHMFYLVKDKVAERL